MIGMRTRGWTSHWQCWQCLLRWLFDRGHSLRSQRGRTKDRAAGVASIWTHRHGLQGRHRETRLRYILPFIQAYTIRTFSGEYSRLVMYFLFKRNIGFYLLQIYLPSMLIVIISWVRRFPLANQRENFADTRTLSNLSKFIKHLKRRSGCVMI